MSYLNPFEDRDTECWNCGKSFNKVKYRGYRCPNCGAWL